MFGYLNLGNAKLIGNTEAQEAVNCRVDDGKLRYVSWPADEVPQRRAVTPEAGLGWAVKSSGSYPSFGSSIIFERAGKGNDKLGIAVPATGPTLSVTSYSKVLENGDYAYLATLYCPETGEELQPIELGSITIANPGDTPTFTLAPGYGSTYPLKSGLVWRFYRRSPASEEYQLIPTTTMDAVSGAAGPNYDLTVETDLGDAIDSIDNGVVTSASSIVWWNDKLWVAYGNMVRFSKTLKPWAFPEEFSFLLDSNTTGFYPFGETLIITTRDKKPRVIYGDNEDNYVMKDADAEFGFVLNGGRIVAGKLVIPSQSKKTLVSTPETKDVLVDGLAVFSASPVSVSSKVRDLFPRIPFANTSGIESHECQTGVVDNRFYCVELNATALPIATPQVSLFSNDQFVLVFDAMTNGFLMGDSTATFRYRTKEFAVPPKARQVKRLFVETKGQVTVEIYLNGTLATTMAFNNSKEKVDWFPTKPWPADSFSFRFIGQPGAEVYSFGVVDPAMEVGG